jgi:hypothetical protein
MAYAAQPQAREIAVTPAVHHDQVGLADISHPCLQIIDQGTTFPLDQICEAHPPLLPSLPIRDLDQSEEAALDIPTSPTTIG